MWHSTPWSTQYVVKKTYTDDGDKTRGGKNIYSRCFDGVPLLQSLQDLEKYQKKSGLNFALDNCNTPISNFISVREPDTWFEWKMGNKDNWKNTKSLSRF